MENLDQLLTEARNPASTNLDELGALDIVRLMNAEDGRVIPAVAAQAERIAQAIEAIADRLRAGGRLIYVGAGTSGRLGVLDATECPPTFNSPPGQAVGLIAGGPTALTQAVEGAEDHPEYADRDLEAVRLTAQDVLCGIATSGRTPYVLGAARYARGLGAFTIGLSCNPDSALGGLVDLDITVAVGPEVLSGSTRLKAGTATKLVLNMLTTGAMIRLGKTFGNLMVDLKATNNKLRARTNRIIRILTGLDTGAAEVLLKQCNGELKTALVAQLGRLPPEQARERLRAAGGQVRQALSGVLSAGPPSHELDPTLFLGIDGGGSHTVALVARAHAEATGSERWTVLGRGQAGPSNLHAVGKARALAALDQAVAGAFAAAGLARRPVAAICLGMAGVDRPDEKAEILEWARQSNLAGQVITTNDAALLLAAGTPHGWGIAIVAGTGSIAFGKSPDGRTARAGGWGYLLGDEGSGYLLVMHALQAVVRAADGRSPPTVLTERLLTRFGLQRPSELIPTVYRGAWDRARLAALAPLVLEAATTDTVAQAIVQRGAAELADMTAAVARGLGLDRIALALTGGLLLESESYRAKLIDALHALDVHADPVALVHEPAEGALRMAIEAVRPAIQ
jgi:N-acetylmuramic acid 6-phosphate etherase